MYSIEVTYSNDNKIVDCVSMELSDMELGSFLNLLNKNYSRLYSVECSKHSVFGFKKNENKVVVKVEH